MKQRISTKNLLSLALLMFALSALVAALYFRSEYLSIVNDPKLSGLINSHRVVEEVKQLVQLPDEQPTVYSISDISKFKDQPILAKALPGDYFLVFTANKRGVLYRPSERKIVEIGSINFQAASSPVDPE